jgi:hypothetical protein
MEPIDYGLIWICAILIIMTFFASAHSEDEDT